MRRATPALALVLGVVALSLPADAAPGPTTTKTVPYRDATPDPTGALIGADGHCSGLLPREAPYRFTAPARGTLKVTLGGFSGDWSLFLLDATGRQLAETDATPPDYETLTTKVKKAGAVVDVLPCNIAGTPDGTITLAFTST